MPSLERCISGTKGTAALIGFLARKDLIDCKSIGVYHVIRHCNSSYKKRRFASIKYKQLQSNNSGTWDSLLQPVLRQTAPSKELHFAAIIGTSRRGQTGTRANPVRPSLTQNLKKIQWKCSRFNLHFSNILLYQHWSKHKCQIILNFFSPKIATFFLSKSKSAISQVDLKQKCKPEAKYAWSLVA